MRTIGSKAVPSPQLQPSAAALGLAITHQATGVALMRFQSTGIAKGIYRFASHEAANRASEEALARAMAQHAKWMVTLPP